VALAGCSSGSSGAVSGPSDALPPGEGGGANGAGAGDAPTGDATGDATGDGNAVLGDAALGDAATGDARADAGPLDDYASGTRLRAELYETADGGAKLWHGWYDSTLSASCTFRSAEDGTMRCLPNDSYVQFFTDMQCSVPVGATGTGCAAPRYVGYQPSGCNLQIYKAGAKLAPSTPLFQRNGTSCVSATPTVDAYALTHVDPTTLVAGAETSDPRTTTLGAEYLRSEDGALQPLGSYDSTLAVGCEPLAAAYANVCAPKDVVLVQQAVYSDMQCTMRVARTFDAACIGTRTRVEVQTFDSCNAQTIALYTLGAQTSSTVYTVQGTTCTATTNPTGFSSFALGAAIPASSLPGVATADVGSGRIVTRYQTASTGERLTPLTLVDTQLGAPCSVMSTTSGLRCIPGQYGQELYSDSMCMDPIAFVSHPAGCAAPPAPKFVTWGGYQDACNEPTATHLLQVGASISVSSGGAYGNGPPCGSSAIDPNGIDFYSASEVDPTTLPAITDVTE
jgi:hypothetical protein